MASFFKIFNRKPQHVNDSSIAVDRGQALLTGRAYPALENSAFWSCVTKLCRQYATMPVHLYHQNGNYRNRVTDSAVAYLLKHPCTYMTAYQWRFIQGFNFEMHGVAMAIIQKSGKTVTNLFPVSPKLMNYRWDNGKLIWKYTKTGEEFTPDQVLRITNTPIGYADVLSPVDYSGADLELASNSKILQTNYYKNGASIGGVLTVPRGTSKEIKQQIASMVANSYSGTVNSHKTMVLEDSMKYEPIHLDEADVSKIQSAQSWTVDEIARRFGVPPFFCGDMQKATYANAEQQGMDVVIYALQPRFIAWEDALQFLCGDNEYIKFSLTGLMRGDHSARSSFYHNAIMDGWMSVNDVRELEDLNPIEGGDSHYFPLNYGRINKDGSIEQPASTSTSTGFNPFDLPTEQKESVQMSEKKRQDMLFLEATNNVTKTNRGKIEAIMRKQIKVCTDKLNMLMAANYDNKTIAQELQNFCNSINVEYGQQYVEVFKDVIYRLLPIVKKQIGSNADVNTEALDAYAGKFGQQMAGRFGTQRVKEVEKTESYEELEELENQWAVVPSEDAMEETQRAGNAFNVFLYGQLGLTYMHVVAAPDACEFCHNLDGKVVEVNGNILTKGEETPDGQGNIRHINKNYKHPPFHTYCLCGVAPGK